MKRVIGWLVLLLSSVGVQAAELSVRIDRDKLYEDETLVMSVQLSGASSGLSFDPQLSDFEILQRSQSSQTQIFNGQRSDSQSWELSLAPLRSGSLTIPAFSLGGASSQPINVEVESIAVRAQRPEDRPFFLRVELSELQPYVQQQVIYTMKLYQQQAIIDGNVSEPQHPQIQLERLGLDRSYTETVDGREYSVLERRYAIFPQRSGEIVLPSINLNARVEVGTRSNRFFARNTRSIRVRAPSQTLQVQSAPAAFKGSWWLASKGLSASAKWVPEQAQLGQPQTLELVVQAEGVMPSQIPLMSLERVGGARVYEDGSRAAKQAGADGVVSQRVTRWTVVPTRPGQLRVEPFELSWWDLENERQESLEIPVPALLVSGEAAAVAPGSNSEEPAVEREAAQEGDTAAVEPQANPEQNEGSLARRWLSDWRTLVVLIAVVGLAALVIRRRRRRPLPLQSDEQLRSPDAALVRLMEAVTRADIKYARDAMLDWGSGVFAQEIRSLAQLATHLDDADFRRLVMELDELCYRDKQRWTGEPLLEKVKAYKYQASVALDREELPALS